VSGRAEERERRAAERGYRVYGYRWVVLGVVMLVNFVIQILWIGYGSIIADAVAFTARRGAAAGRCQSPTPS
jgi:hypothetical protein